MEHKDSSHLSEVGCGVVNCKFHGKDNYCHAECINVESPKAIVKGETFCSTFTVRSSD